MTKMNVNVAQAKIDRMIGEGVLRVVKDATGYMIFSQDMTKHYIAGCTAAGISSTIDGIAIGLQIGRDKLGESAEPQN